MPRDSNCAGAARSETVACVSSARVRRTLSAFTTRGSQTRARATEEKRRRRFARIVATTKKIAACRLNAPIFVGVVNLTRSRRRRRWRRRTKRARSLLWLRSSSESLQIRFIARSQRAAAFIVAVARRRARARARKRGTGHAAASAADLRAPSRSLIERALVFSFFDASTERRFGRRRTRGDGWPRRW